MLWLQVHASVPEQICLPGASRLHVAAEALYSLSGVRTLLCSIQAAAAQPVLQMGSAGTSKGK